MREIPNPIPCQARTKWVCPSFVCEYSWRYRRNSWANKTTVGIRIVSGVDRWERGSGTALDYFFPGPFPAGKPKGVGAYGDSDEKECEKEPVPVFLPPILRDISLLYCIFDTYILDICRSMCTYHSTALLCWSWSADILPSSVLVPFLIIVGVSAGCCKRVVVVGGGVCLFMNGAQTLSYHTLISAPPQVSGQSASHKEPPPPWLSIPRYFDLQKHSPATASSGQSYCADHNGLH